MTAATRLHEAIREAHIAVGAPSCRTIARRIEKRSASTWSGLDLAGEFKALSHTTVNDVIKGKRVPKLETLLLIVDALDGDRRYFKKLWQDAQPGDDALPRATGSRTGEPAVSFLSAEDVLAHHRLAENLFKEGSFEDTERQLDLVTAAAQHNKARVLHTRGRWAEAEDLYRKVLKTRRHLLGEEDEETLNTRNNLALVLFDQEKVDEAQSEHEAVYLAFMNLYGENHEITLACRYNRARILYRSGRLGDAEMAFRSVIEVLRRTPDRRVLLVVQNNLGRLLYDRGDLPAARAELEAVMGAQRELLLRDDHQDLLRTRHNMALVLRREGKREEAERELKDVLKLQRQVLGERHAHVFDTRYRLALLEYDRRRFELTDEEFCNVMDDQAELLGANHPDTLKTRRKHALAMHDQDEAARELRAVIDLQMHTLGADHYETAKTRRNLAGLLAGGSDKGPVGQKNEALSLPAV
jgi:tetratricopeptide (TPR) repeat protein